MLIVNSCATVGAAAACDLPQLGGSLFGRVQGLAKLQEAAKIALATEMKQLGLAVRGGSGEQASLADAGSANSGIQTGYAFACQP